MNRLHQACVLGVLLVSLGSDAPLLAKEIEKPDAVLREGSWSVEKSASMMAREKTIAERLVDPYPQLGRRRLVVANKSGRRIRVFVAYRTKHAEGDWRWENLKFTLGWDLDPGQNTLLADGKNADGSDKVINADYINIYAESLDGRLAWMAYKTKDLVIGEGAPAAGVIGDYTFTFSP